MRSIEVEREGEGGTNQNRKMGIFKGRVENLQKALIHTHAQNVLHTLVHYIYLCVHLCLNTLTYMHTRRIQFRRRIKDAEMFAVCQLGICMWILLVCASICVRVCVCVYVQMG